MTTPTQPPAPPERPTPATDLAGVECLLSEARSHYDSAERDEAFAALLSWARRAVERAEAAEALADRLAGELRECRSMLDALPRSHGSHRFDLIKDCVACQVAETMRTTGEALLAYDEAKKGGGR